MTIIAEGNAPDSDSVENSAGDVASDVRKDLATMNARIDDVVAFQRKKGPWYRDTSLLIAGAAFFVSLVTSGISAYRTYRQDINSREDALHSIIQQSFATSLSSVATQFSIQKDLNGTTDPKYPLFKQCSTADCPECKPNLRQTSSLACRSIGSECVFCRFGGDWVTFGSYEPI